jgi:methionine salvage enolase-phosphatase E1
VYVDVSEEMKMKELQYQKILQEYQGKKRSLTAAREREAKKVSDLFAKDASSHNFRLLQRKVCMKSYHDNNFSSFFADLSKKYY